MRLKPLLCLLAVLTAGSAVLPTAASGSAINLSIMMDDDLLLYRGDDVRDNTLRRMQRLGADAVRVTVLWSVVAEDARRTAARRRRFDPVDPRTYPRTNWDKYDRLARACETLEILCYFNVTGPGPRWAHKKAPRAMKALQRTWRPKPEQFRKFVQAVGTRYNGSYLDENDLKDGQPQVLPRISFWSIYNEPNQGGWLTPQWERRKGVRYSASAQQYRELWLQGRAGLDNSQHQNDVVLFGETAPLGSSGRGPKSPIHPKTFIAELFCVNRFGTPFSGRNASARKCSTLKKIGEFRATAFAHHPYTKRLPPTRRDKDRQSITMANIGELGALMDRMADKTKRIRKTLPLILTEFGYETDPPDPRNGVSPADQARYINIGDYLAYKDPRIFGNTQFLLQDVGPLKQYKKTDRRYWFTYQSGLFGVNGRPKPAATAYAMPFHVTGQGIDSVGQQATRFWGQLRFLPNGMRSQVEIQFKPQGGSQFVTIGDPVPVTNGVGFWEASRPVIAAGTFRAIWRGAHGVTVTSREIPTS